MIDLLYYANAALFIGCACIGLALLSAGLRDLGGMMARRIAQRREA